MFSFSSAGWKQFSSLLLALSIRHSQKIAKIYRDCCLAPSSFHSRCNIFLMIADILNVCLNNYLDLRNSKDSCNRFVEEKYQGKDFLLQIFFLLLIEFFNIMIALWFRELTLNVLSLNTLNIWFKRNLLYITFSY